MKRLALSIMILGALAASGFAQAPAVPSDAERVSRLESRVKELESQIQKDEGLLEKAQDESAVVFLYMCFCGVLASTNGRRFWLWFFLGIFTVPTLVILAVLIGGSHKKGRHAEV